MDDKFAKQNKKVKNIFIRFVGDCSQCNNK